MAQCGPPLVHVVRDVHDSAEASRSTTFPDAHVLRCAASPSSEAAVSRFLVASTAILCAMLAMPGRTIGAGHPDLQGNWTNRFATPLERPIELRDRPLLTDAEVAALNKASARSFDEGHVMVVPSGRSLLTLLNDPSHFDTASTYDPAFFTEMEFENRTSLITDPPSGRLPDYTPAGRQRRDAREPPPQAVTDLPLATRCVSFGMPRIAGIAGTPSAGIYAYYQIVQTSEYVVFFMEAIHDARIIPLNDRVHLPPSIRTWNGDSRGRWEGDALVVDTTNFRPETDFLGAGEHMHLTERFRLVAPDELDYEIRVEDPATWTRPWTAMVRLKRTKEQLYEFACHEGNTDVVKEILTAPKDPRVP